VTIDEIARVIMGMRSAFVTRVAIDGVDGAGKTVFGDKLGRRLEASGAKVIRASVDGFHHPRTIRYRRGRHSPEGFYQDSYDYATLQHALLDPLSPGGSGRYVTAVFDHTADSPVKLPVRQAMPSDVLIFDGIFVHRPELQEYWDLSIFLDVAFEQSIDRFGKRDGGPTDPNDPLNRRYIDGQQLYLRKCAPADRATVVVDNNEIDNPRIARWSGESAQPGAELDGPTCGGSAS
jgi:uridine kinase